MNLLALLLCLCHLAHFAAASIESGKYQWALLWYSYRMNVKAHIAGKADMLIAPHCSGSVLDMVGSCNLDEFLQQTYDKTRQIGGPKGGTAIYELDPTKFKVEEIADAIFNAGYGDALVDPEIISPDVYKDGSTRGRSFGKVFESVIDNVQKIRKAVGDGPLEGELKACKRAIALTIEGRIEENSAELREALEEVMKRSGFTVIYRDDGKKMIDFQATKATNKDDGVKWQRAVKDYVTGNWHEEDSNFLIRHLNAIANCQYIEELLTAPAPC